MRIKECVINFSYRSISATEHDCAYCTCLRIQWCFWCRLNGVAHYCVYFCIFYLPDCPSSEQKRRRSTIWAMMKPWLRNHQLIKWLHLLFFDKFDIRFLSFEADRLCFSCTFIFLSLTLSNSELNFHWENICWTAQRCCDIITHRSSAYYCAYYLPNYYVCSSNSQALPDAACLLKWGRTPVESLISVLKPKI